MAPNITEMTTATQRSRSSEVANAWLNSTAWMAKIKEAGSYKKVSGGEDLVRPILYQKNSTAQRYSDLELLDTTRTEILTAAHYPWRQYSVAVVSSGLETDIQNTGKEQVIDIVATKIDNAEESLIDLLVTDGYGDGTTTGAINGLGNSVPDDPTTGTLGNINRALYSWWQSYKYSGTVDGGVAVSPTNILSYFNSIYLATSLGIKHPTLILCDNIYYNYYWQAAQAIQRLGDSKLAKMGFNALAYCGGDAEVVYDGGIGGHATASHAWFLSPKTFDLCYAAKRNFVPLKPDRVPTNQDATISFLAWAGQFCMKNSRHNGVLIA